MQPPPSPTARFVPVIAAHEAVGPGAHARLELGQEGGAPVPLQHLRRKRGQHPWVGGHPPSIPCPPCRPHLGIEAEPGDRDVLGAPVHAEVLAAGAGLDVARVPTLQPLHEARRQLPAQERVLPVGFLAEGRSEGRVTSVPFVFPPGDPSPASPPSHPAPTELLRHGPGCPNPAPPSSPELITPSAHPGTWFLPHSGCLMMLSTGLKQLSPVWSS